MGSPALIAAPPSTRPGAGEGQRAEFVRSQLVSLPTTATCAGVAGGLGVVVAVNTVTVTVRRLYDDVLVRVAPRSLRDEEVRVGLAAGHTAAMHRWPEAEPAVEQPRPRLVVVACGAAKRSAPAPACELYTGPLFSSSWAAATRIDAPALILSARHGLVAPDTLLAPYDAAVGDVDALDVEQLAAQADAAGVADSDVVVLGSKRYVELARHVWPDALAPLAGCAGIGAMRGRLARIGSWDDAAEAAP
jgi:hypothetical protein